MTETDLNLQWRPVRITPDGPEMLTAIQPEEAAELGKLAKGKYVLEVGSAHGYSAITMAMAGAHRVTAIDDHCGTTWLGDTIGQMKFNAAYHGVDDLIEIIQANSWDALLALQPRKFDLIFIDGAGDFPTVLSDIYLSMMLLEETEGILAIHDYGHPLYPDKERVADLMFREEPDKLVTTLWVKQIV